MLLVKVVAADDEEPKRVPPLFVRGLPASYSLALRVACKSLPTAMCEEVSYDDEARKAAAPILFLFSVEEHNSNISSRRMMIFCIRNLTRMNCFLFAAGDTTAQFWALRMSGSGANEIFGCVEATTDAAEWWWGSIPFLRRRMMTHVQLYVCCSLLIYSVLFVISVQ